MSQFEIPGPGPTSPNPTARDYQAGEYALAVEAERRALIMQAVREHESNAAAEMRRFRAELEHINTVCDLRTRKGNT